MWLSLLRYLLSGQPVWVGDDEAPNSYWYGQIVAVLPDCAVLRVSAGADGSPYLVHVPLARVRCVRERHLGADRCHLAQLFADSPDDPPPCAEVGT